MERFYKELNSQLSEDVLGTKSWKSLCVACIIRYKDNEEMIQDTLDDYCEFCLENDSHSRRFDHLQWLMSLLPMNKKESVIVIDADQIKPINELI